MKLMMCGGSVTAYWNWPAAATAAAWLQCCYTNLQPAGIIQCFCSSGLYCVFLKENILCLMLYTP